jgi:hypothetical protein
MPANDDGDTRGARSASVRTPIPPPGRRLDFDAWCQVLTAELRRYLPAVAATTNGRDRVTWRYGGQEVTAHNDRGCYRIQLKPALWRVAGCRTARRPHSHELCEPSPDSSTPGSRKLTFSKSEIVKMFCAHVAP